LANLPIPEDLITRTRTQAALEIADAITNYGASLSRENLINLAAIRADVSASPPRWIDSIHRSSPPFPFWSRYFIPSCNPCRMQRGVELHRSCVSLCLYLTAANEKQKEHINTETSSYERNGAQATMKMPSFRSRLFSISSHASRRSKMYSLVAEIRRATGGYREISRIFLFIALQRSARRVDALYPIRSGAYRAYPELKFVTGDSDIEFRTRSRARFETISRVLASTRITRGSLAISSSRVYVRDARPCIRSRYPGTSFSLGRRHDSGSRKLGHSHYVASLKTRRRKRFPFTQTFRYLLCNTCCDIFISYFTYSRENGRERERERETIVP